MFSMKIMEHSFKKYEADLWTTKNYKSCVRQRCVYVLLLTKHNGMFSMKIMEHSFKKYEADRSLLFSSCALRQTH